MSAEVVFITGGTGYIGSRLIPILQGSGHEVIALVRKGSEQKVPPGCRVVVGNPFEAASFEREIPAGAVFVQLLGVPHPSPKKGALFFSIDLASAKASAAAAKAAGVSHFIYVSIAMEPANIMKDYQAARAEAEQTLLETKMNLTFIRPWYVVGPGHWWPLLLLPVYKILEWLPATRQKAKALGLVSLRQMLQALTEAVERPPEPLRTVEVAEMRRL